jgi:HPt (histidine-containing phosphotransfer) domain-containing protein
MDSSSVEPAIKTAAASAEVDRLNFLYSEYGRELVTEICQIFCEDGRHQVTLLQEALKDEDLDKIRFLSHKVKSSGTNLGMLEFASICEKLENIPDLENCPTGTLASLLQDLEAEHTKACLKIRYYLRGLKTTSNQQHGAETQDLSFADQHQN